MKTPLLFALLAAATSVLANATTVQLNCTPYPVTISGGVGTTTVSCPALPASSGSINSVTLSYLVDYQFGSLASNTVSVAFTPAVLSGVTWATPSTTVSINGGFSSGSVGQNGSTSTSSVATPASFASPFNVTVTGSVPVGGVGTTAAGVQVTFDYNAVPATPAPASLLLVGLSLVGLGTFYVVRTRSSAKA